eukprot:scaffold37950_cov33-Tisochrysis_lutea.AAC.2
MAAGPRELTPAAAAAAASRRLCGPSPSSRPGSCGTRSSSICRCRLVRSLRSRSGSSSSGLPADTAPATSAAISAERAKRSLARIALSSEAVRGERSASSSSFQLIEERGPPCRPILRRAAGSGSTLGEARSDVNKGRQ